MKIKAKDLPAQSRLFVDYLENYSRLAAYFNIPYFDESAIATHFDILNQHAYPSQQLAEVLMDQNSAFGAGSRTMEHLEALHSGKAYVVITGQQVGLFGGPLYVLYKALTAIKLADRWRRLFQRCFVPVFWLASDDADFVEVNHVTFLEKSFENKTLILDLKPDGQVPVHQIRLGPQIEPVLQALDASLHQTEFKAEILGRLAAAYQPKASMSQAFGTWMMTLLRDFGIVLIDPADRRIKALLTDVFAQEIRERSPSTEAVLETTQRLEKSGYSPQVPLRHGRLNLFYLDGERKALELDGDGFRTTDASCKFTESELLDLVASHPERFSPNVILRGITQDSIFPTAAYIAGPSEIAYFAQLKGVYARFDVPMPVIYPRKSLTLIEPNIDRIIDKFSLTMQDVWCGVDEKLKALARQQLPGSLLEALAAMRESWPQQVLGLRDEVHRVDPTLVKMLENTAGKLRGTIDLLEKKIVQAGKRKNDIARQQLQKVGAALYPNQMLQERVHNVTPYLVKYGPLFIERLYEVLDIAGYCHQIVRL